MSFGTFSLPDQEGSREGSRKGCSQIGIIGDVDFRSVALPRGEFRPQICLDRGNGKAPIDKKLRTAYEEGVQTGGQYSWFGGDSAALAPKRVTGGKPVNWELASGVGSYSRQYIGERPRLTPVIAALVAHIPPTAEIPLSANSPKMLIL